MSDNTVEEVAAALDRFEQCWKELGCNMVSPFMTMSLLSLPVLPEMRLTGRSLVDTLQFNILDLISE